MKDIFEEITLHQIIGHIYDLCPFFKNLSSLMLAKQYLNKRGKGLKYIIVMFWEKHVISIDLTKTLNIIKLQVYLGVI